MNKTVKLLLLCTFALLGGISAQAQERAVYHFDNFDTSKGVSVETPPETDRLPAQRMRLTAKTTDRAGSPLARTPEELLQRQRAASGRTGAMLKMTVSQSLDGFTTGDVSVDKLIVESGARNGVDPVLIYAIMHKESAFKKQAVSYKGARGLMQLMPATARRFGVQNIFDPRQNIEGGARYMRFLLDLFGGDVALSLAGYNAGEGAVMKYGRQVPPYNETQDYVRRITQRYSLMRDPQAARKAQTLTPAQAIAIRETTPRPPVYERVVYSVQLPNGQLMLISQ
jgi:soluble lytic murein transglycosylase-like protein